MLFPRGAKNTTLLLCEYNTVGGLIYKIEYNIIRLNFNCWRSEQTEKKKNYKFG